MPDLQQFQITPLGNASVPMFRFTVSAQITDSQTGAILFDFTGANAITFPADLPTLLSTAADRREFVQMLANYLLRKKAGLE